MISRSATAGEIGRQAGEGKAMATNLIQCGDHKWAPWSCVCVHLLADPRLEWVTLEAEPGEQSD
jgi:hypothetical protein